MNQELKKIIYSLHPLERAVLPYLEDKATIQQITENTELSESEITTGIQLLEQKHYLELVKQTTTFISLDTLGEQFKNQDLPEIQVLKELEEKEKPVSELNLSQEIVGSALGELKKQGLVDTKKQDTLHIKPTQKGIEYLKTHTNPLKEIENGIEESEMSEREKEIVKQFENRKGFLKKQTKKSFSIKINEKGKKLIEEFNTNYKNLDLIETLTTDMLKNKTWKNKEFRHYPLDIPTTIPQLGRRHPMLEANSILSQIFLEMGFKEMKGPLIESAFWNMDVMWIPQDHPARDEQDTFYLNGKAQLPEKEFENVKQMHEEGIKHTHTNIGEFSKDIASKRLLRTHSTATTFRLLKELGEKQKKGETINGKYFYLANVFRNEAIDATHLAEFYQGEGFIIGDNLSLADLMGFVKEYLTKLGYKSIRFKPTFNPYTEPSMEAHVYDPEIGKSYALINSGIFRPETLKPMGLENKTIIAWGFGASRIAAKLSGKTSMREITGTTCDFEWLRTRPVMEKKVEDKKTPSSTHLSQSQSLIYGGEK